MAPCSSTTPTDSAPRTSHARARVLVALVAALVGEPRLPSVAIAAVTVSAGRTHGARRRRRLARAAHPHRQPFRRALRHGDRRASDLALSLLAWRHGKAGAWVVVSGLLRYAFVAGGAAAPWLRAPLPPAGGDRPSDYLQIAALILCRRPFSAAGENHRSAAGLWRFGAALVMLAWSFLIQTRVAVAPTGVRRGLAAAAAIASSQRVALVPVTSGRRRRFGGPESSRSNARRSSCSSSPRIRRSRRAVTRRGWRGLWLAALGRARPGPLRRRHHAGALRPRHQSLLGRPLHAGCRRDDCPRGTSLAHRRRLLRRWPSCSAALFTVPVGVRPRRRCPGRTARSRRALGSLAAVLVAAFFLGYALEQVGYWFSAPVLATYRDQLAFVLEARSDSVRRALPDRPLAPI